MTTAKPFLKNLIAKSPAKNKLFKRNLLKEYLQVLVLDFIYSHPQYSRLVFYGGSCLSHCFGLPRLSEDLDFVDLKKKVKIEALSEDLRTYFKKETDLDVRTAVQKFRIYLKFPLLHELEIAGPGESDLLFLKIEVFKEFDFCKRYKTEITPFFKYNKSILIKTFDLSTLMATKIRAVLHRKWEKTDKEGRTLAKVKGRDYFDLMWYLEKNVQPNINCIEKIKEKKELKEKLLEIVTKIDAKSIQFDLEALIEDSNFVKNLSGNLKQILSREIKNKL